jgi:hypothetical protein
VYQKPSAPSGIGGVLDDSFKLYRNAFAKSWGLALCGQVLLAIPAMVLRFQIKGANFTAGNAQAALAVFRSPSVWLSYLVMVVVAMGFYNALVAQIDGSTKSREQSVGASMRTGFRLLPRSILLIVVLMGAVLVAALAAGIVIGGFSRFLSPIVSGVIVAALAVAAIYVWGRAFLANIALVVEDALVFRSLGISWTLIKGHWWRTATVYSVALIIVMVFYVIIIMANGIVGVALRGSFAAATALSQLVSILGGTFLMSFLPAVLLSMYYDLKLRKEGSDLADRVNALAPE